MFRKFWSEKLGALGRLGRLGRLVGGVMFGLGVVGLVIFGRFGMASRWMTELSPKCACNAERFGGVIGRDGIDGMAGRPPPPGRGRIPPNCWASAMEQTKIADTQAKPKIPRSIFLFIDGSLDEGGEP